MDTQRFTRRGSFVFESLRQWTELVMRNWGGSNWSKHTAGEDMVGHKLVGNPKSLGRVRIRSIPGVVKGEGLDYSILPSEMSSSEMRMARGWIRQKGERKAKGLLSAAVWTVDCGGRTCPISQIIGYPSIHIQEKRCTSLFSVRSMHVRTDYGRTQH